jgi:7,8-dihydropterin-6-yl-methyl-4-(beta-D-ribofuranosyl)aminobenzene 5'-phosphate synthase
MDERYLAVDVLGKGLVIFSACSHAGIVNVVQDAIAKFSRPIYMVRLCMLLREMLFLTLMCR